jgi:hypothetical protein
MKQDASGSVAGQSEESAVRGATAPVDSAELDVLAEKLARGIVDGMGLNFDEFEPERRGRLLAQARIVVTGLDPKNGERR